MIFPSPKDSTMKSELKLFWLDSEVRECPSGFGRRVNAEHLSYKFSLSTAQEKPKGLNCSRLTIKIQHRVCTVGAMQTWKDCYYLDEQFQPGLRPWERESSHPHEIRTSAELQSLPGSWLLCPRVLHTDHTTQDPNLESASHGHQERWVHVSLS